MTIDENTVEQGTPYVLPLDAGTFYLDLILDEGVTLYSYDLAFIVQSGPITLNNVPASPTITPLSYFASPETVTDEAGMYRVRDSIMMGENGLTGLITVIDNVLCTYAGGAPAVVELVVQSSNTTTSGLGWGIEPGTVLGHIEFIPEPATLALLAAGGLLARRRRSRN
jgi:hypothetical protein